MTSNEPGLLHFLVGPILDHEENDQRFERFSNDVVSEMEGGLAVYPTSKSWDLGRDGRGLSKNVEVVVASGLTAAVSTKVAEDLERMRPFLPEKARVYFCTPKLLSDYAKQDLEVAFRARLPAGVGFIALSRTQILHAIERNPQIFLRHYAAEYAEAKRAIAEVDASADGSSEALRLVLTIVSDDDSNVIRDDLYDVLVLDHLSKTSSSILQISNGVSGALGLGRSLPEDLVGRVLERARGRGLVDTVGSLFFLTTSGREQVVEKQKVAAGQLIEGRQRFRSALEEELGYALVDEHYNKIWLEVRSTLAVSFYERGNQMVEILGSMVSAIGGQTEIQIDKEVEAQESEEDAGLSFAKDLARRVGLTSSLPGQQEELATAVKDIFSDPSSEVAEWLVALCAKFVMLCSLGVEHQSGAGLAEALSKVNLVLDTDVVISFLCEGEPQHEAAVAIVARWPRIGGRIYVAEPVLAEVAHHAWIAEFDIQQCVHWIRASKEDRGRYIENAFVRAFAELVAQGKAKPGDWSRYIRQFKGDHADDFTKIAAILTRDHSGIEVLPELQADEVSLRDQVLAFLTAKAGTASDGRLIKIAKDKAARDAELYASMMSLLRIERRKHPDTNCILVSSAKRLLQVEAKFKRAGEQHLVLNAGALVYLLSLVPGVSIGLGAMEAFLFDSRGIRFSSEIERKVVRLIAQSKEYRPLGFARRTGLVRDLKERLFDIADRSSGGAKDEVVLSLLKKASVSDEVAVRVSTALKDSLDALAVDTKTEVELRKTKELLVAAERRIEQLVAQKAQPTKPKPYRAPRPRK